MTLLFGETVSAGEYYYSCRFLSLLQSGQGGRSWPSIFCPKASGKSVISHKLWKDGVDSANPWLKTHLSSK